MSLAFKSPDRLSYTESSRATTVNDFAQGQRHGNIAVRAFRSIVQPFHQCMSCLSDTDRKMIENSLSKLCYNIEGEMILELEIYIFF